MTQVIIDLKNHQPFGDLNKGQAFVFDDKAYTKLSDILYETNEAPVNAVRIHDGVGFYFTNTTQVDIVGKITVEA